jgi:hypothetical protein
MKTLAAFILAALALPATAGAASVDLWEAEIEIRESIRATSLPRSSDYCLATFRTGETAPKAWYSLDCKKPKPEPIGGRFCWHLDLEKIDSCQRGEGEFLRRTMLLRDYSETGVYQFDLRRESPKGWRVYQKGNAAPGGFCLVRRAPPEPRFPWKEVSDWLYTIDCGDKAPITTRGLDAGDSTDGIRRFMSDRGYAIAESFSSSSGNYLLFKRK